MAISGRIVTFALVLALIVPRAIGGGGSTMYIVDDDEGSWSDFQTILDAINASSGGDTIRVFEGTYPENIVIDRTLTLTGNGSGSTVITPTGSGDPITITGNDVVIEELMIDPERNDTTAIIVQGDGTVLRNITIRNAFNGVVLENCSENELWGVDCLEVGNGLVMESSDNNTVVDSNFSQTSRKDVRISERAEISFAAAADQHYGSLPIPPYDSETVDDWMVHPDLPQFDFVLASMGDWISNYRDTNWSDTDYTWDRITELNADHQMIPYFWIYGNHDISTFEDMANGNPVRKELMGRNISGMNENNYAFMYNNMLFISAAQTNCLYTLSAFQKAWIDDLVERYPNTTTVIMAHQGTEETNGIGNDRASTWLGADYRVHNDIDWWRPLFRNNPQIVLYIHGHNEKAEGTISFDEHPDKWDDDCTFVLVPSNGRGDRFTPIQDAWSYIFTITDEDISITMWNSTDASYQSDASVGVPYTRSGMSNNLTSTGMEWFSIPKQVLDGQKWTWQNHFVAESYHVELIGTNQTEQIDNPELDGCHESDEKEKKDGFWYAVRGDDDALNKATGETDGYIRIPGGNTLAIAMTPTWSGGSIEGKVPYNTAIAIPGKTYVFSCSVKTESDNGSIDLKASIPVYLNINKFVWKNVVIGSNITVDTVLDSYSAELTVPDNDSAWFIQPKIKFYGDVNYRLENWSLKMVGDANYTTNFSLTLNGETYSVDGAQDVFDNRRIEIRPTTMDNLLDFNVSIEGNKVGIVRLIYERPQLWSDDVSFGILDAEQTSVRLEDRSPYNNRTTVMSFEGATWALQGFDRTPVRGKYLYVNPKADDSIDGNYTLVRDVSGVGIEIRNSDNNVIRRSIVRDFNVGIVIELSDDNTIKNNTIFDNPEYGVMCINSSGNLICDNNLAGYWNHSSGGYDDTGNNRWNSTVSGNYWSDYTGIDDDLDGLGDTPYPIDGPGNATDNKPWMKSLEESPPVVIPEFGAFVPLMVSIAVALSVIWRRLRGSRSNCAPEDHG